MVLKKNKSLFLLIGTTYIANKVSSKFWRYSQN